MNTTNTDKGDDTRASDVASQSPTPHNLVASMNSAEADASAIPEESAAPGGPAHPATPHNSSTPDAPDSATPRGSAASNDFATSNAPAHFEALYASAKPGELADFVVPGGPDSWSLTALLRAVGRYACIGVGTGSFFFLLVMAAAPGWVPANRLSITTLFIMSALIGELQFLFAIEHVAAYIAHCLLAFGLVLGWIFANGWSFSAIRGGLPAVALTFVVIYAIIWILVCVHTRSGARKMNARLHSRRQGPQSR